MARLISSVGNVSYNGIVFPSAIHSKVQARPTYSQGEVNRKYVHYTITIDTMLTYTDPPLSAAVTNNQDMGANSVQYRKLLTEPRKTLTFGEQGFGDFVVNNFAGAVPNGYRSVKDVAFGPKPRLLVWEPVGSNRAAHVTWVCETCIPECLSNSVRDTNVLLEATQESSFTVNQEGLLTRTTRATIEIASTVINGSNLSDTVDNYVERFKPPVIAGFHRETHRQINRDHRILNITYTDTEIASDNPFFPGMVAMDVSHTVGSTLNKEGFIRWMSTMSGTFRWAKGVPSSLAWSAFAGLVRDRFGRNKPVQVFNNANNSKKIKRTNIPHSISITEQLYNREASFTISWFSTVPLADLFAGTGLFSRVPNMSWSQWHTSLEKIQSPFGGSQIREKAADIKIVDVCGIQDANPPKKTTPETSTPAPQPWFSFSCSDVKPSESWLDCGTPSIRIFGASGVIAEFPAYGPSNNTVLAPDPTKTPSSSGFDPSTVVVENTSPSNEPSYQNRYVNEYVLEVTGTYSRVCYEPYPPSFKSYGDVPLILHKSDFKIKTVNGQFFPLHVLTYKQTYLLSRLPPGNARALLKTDAGNGDR